MWTPVARGQQPELGAVMSSRQLQAAGPATVGWTARPLGGQRRGSAGLAATATAK